MIGSGFLFKPLAGRTDLATSNLIDVHHHILPPIWQRRDRREDCLIPLGMWNVKEALAEMDSVGVHTTILSMPTSSGWFVDPADYRGFVRDCNEYAARVVSAHPDRFGFFASVPLPDADGTLAEIEYAIDVLKADGIHLATNYGVRWIGDQGFAAVFQKLDERAAVASIHPPGANCCRTLSGYLPHREEAPKEMAGALTSLRKNPALARLRKIRFLFSHGADTASTLSSAQL